MTAPTASLCRIDPERLLRAALKAGIGFEYFPDDIQDGQFIFEEDACNRLAAAYAEAECTEPWT